MVINSTFLSKMSKSDPVLTDAHTKSYNSLLKIVPESLIAQDDVIFYISIRVSHLPPNTDRLSEFL